jgi:hypothetical protein
MKKFFKFSNNQTEYDGPAASAPIYRRNSTGNSHSGSSKTANIPDDILSSEGIVWSVASSVTHSEKNRRASDPASDTSKTGKDASSKVSRSTKSRTSIDRSRPLASGISSRRTHHRVEKHLSADKMSGHKDTTTLQSIDEKCTQNDAYNVSHTPMHHDGGVTCLLPLPSIHDHRFLSGGVDGTIQLWSIVDNPHRDPCDTAEKLYPQ